MAGVKLKSGRGHSEILGKLDVGLKLLSAITGRKHRIKPITGIE
jgi:hypothetical protein